MDHSAGRYARGQERQELVAPLHEGDRKRCRHQDDCLAEAVKDRADFEPVVFADVLQDRKKPLVMLREVFQVGKEIDDDIEAQETDETDRVGLYVGPNQRSIEQGHACRL